MWAAPAKDSLKRCKNLRKNEFQLRFFVKGELDLESMHMKSSTKGIEVHHIKQHGTLVQPGLDNPWMKMCTLYMWDLAKEKYFVVHQKMQQNHKDCKIFHGVFFCIAQLLHFLHTCTSKPLFVQDSSHILFTCNTCHILSIKPIMLFTCVPVER